MYKICCSVRSYKMKEEYISCVQLTCLGSAAAIDNNIVVKVASFAFCSLKKLSAIVVNDVPEKAVMHINHQ